MTELKQLQREQIIDYLREHPEDILEILKETLQETEIKGEIQKLSEEEYWNKKIVQLFTKIQVPISSQGYGFLREAVLETITNSEVNRIGYLYKLIAERHHTKITNVERSLRFVKEEVWEKGKIAKIPEFAIYNKVPTNTQFVKTLAEYVCND